LPPAPWLNLNSDFSEKCTEDQLVPVVQVFLSVRAVLEVLLVLRDLEVLLVKQASDFEVSEDLKDLWVSQNLSAQLDLLALESEALL
jgi:hypothetical protein